MIRRWVGAACVAALLAACGPGTGGKDAGAGAGAGAQGAAAVPGGRGPDDAADREVLDRIVHAETSLDYSGTRIVSYGPPGSSRESRLRLVGRAGRTSVAWASPGDAAPSRRWKAACRFAWVKRPDLLLRNYTVRLDPAPSPPVAWRETRRVLVEGRRPGRPTMELLVDAEHWLVLAESCRTSEGEEWLRGRFEEVEFGVGDASDVPGASEPLPEARTADSPSSAPVPLTVGWLPEGFERVATRRTDCGGWVEDFSDGLAALSVRQRAPGDTVAPEGEVRRSRWLGGLSLSGRVCGVEATVQGGLPDSDLLAVFRTLGAPQPAR